MDETLEPDPVVRAYLADVDRTLIAKNLRLTPEERLRQLMALQQQDLDVVYERSPENLERLARALAAHEPYLRGAPSGLPFVFDVETLQRGLNFTLTSKLGDLDLLGEIVGGGGYAALEPHAVPMELFGVRCLVLGLDKLIEVKRAAGRPRDLETLAELIAIREAQR